MYGVGGREEVKREIEEEISLLVIFGFAEYKKEEIK